MPQDAGPETEHANGAAVGAADSPPCGAPELRALASALAAFARRSILHAFEYRGRYHVADPVTGVLFTTDAATHALAVTLASCLDEDDLARAAESAGVERARALLDDLSRLQSDAGMFLRQSMRADDRAEALVTSYVAHHPRKMMLCVSETCNLRCVYCYAVERNFHDAGRLMSLSTAQRAMEYLAQRAGSRRSLTVTLFGGEPLIAFPMIRELVGWAGGWAASIGKRVHFCITTNGTLLSDEVIDFLAGHDFSIMVSLDGPKPVQDRSRPNAGGRGSFDLVAPNLRRLLERHPHPEIVIVRATMTHESHDARRLAQFMTDFGFQRVGLGADVGYAFAKSEWSLTREDRLALLRTTDELLGEGLLEATIRGERRPYNPIARSLVALHRERDARGPRPRISCGVCRNDQAVGVDGAVYPCHRYAGVRAYAIGDVFNGLDSRRVESYYRDLLRAHVGCAACWASHWCGGQCSHYLSAPDGRVHAPDVPACDVTRAAIERSLALYERMNERGVDWRDVARVSDC